jgi:beta-lactamase regulating signal transducer with metallopeptidase domain
VGSGPLAAINPAPAYAHGVAGYGSGLVDDVVSAAPTTIVVVWLVGALVAFGLVLLSHRRAAALMARAGELLDVAWRTDLRNSRALLGMRDTVRLRSSGSIDTPMAGGLLRRVVLVPELARRWSAERRRFVLLHELVHLARRDPVRHLVARVALALHWLNPLAWAAAHCAMAAREEACDETVLALGAKPSRYARQLLRLHEVLRPTNNAAVAALPMIQRSLMEKRVMNILRNDRRPLRRPVAVGLIALAGVTTLSVAAAAPQEQEPEKARVEAKVEPRTAVNVEPRVEEQVESDVKVQTEFKIEPDVKVQTEFKIEPDVRVQTEFKVEPDVKVQTEFKIEPDMRVQTEIKVEPDVRVQTKVKVAPRVDVKVEPGVGPTPDPRTAAAPRPVLAATSRSAAAAVPRPDVGPDAVLAPAVPVGYGAAVAPMVAMVPRPEAAISVGASPAPMPSAALAPSMTFRGIPTEALCVTDDSDDARGNMTVERSGGRTVYRQSSARNGDFAFIRELDDAVVCMRTAGDVEFDESRGRVSHIGAEGLVVWEAHTDAGAQRLEVRADDNYTWSVNGDPRAFDTDARAWFQGMQDAVGLQWEISSVRGEVAGKRGEIASIRGQRASTRGQMAAARGEVARMRGQIASANGHAASQHGQIAALNGQVSTLKGAIATHHGAIASLRAQFRRASDQDRARMELQMAEHQAKIEQLHQQLSEFEGQAQADKEAIEAALHEAQLEGQVQEIEQEIAEYNLAARLAELELAEQELAVEANVERIEAEIEALNAQERIEDLEGELEPALERLSRLIETIR